MSFSKKRYDYRRLSLKRKEKVTCLFFLIILGLIMMFVYEAGAFLNPAKNNQLSVNGRGILPSRQKITYERINKGQLRRFKNNIDNNEGWVGVWNPWGTIHRLYPIKAPPTARLRGVDNIKDHIITQANDFIREYSEFLKVSEGDLLFEGITYRAGIFYCRFLQFYRDIKVYGGGLEFRFNRGGSLLLIGGDTYPGIDILPYPSVDSERAVKIARQKVGFSGDGGKLGEVGLFVLPFPSEDGIEYLLAWQVPVFSDSTLGSSVIFVDAHSGELILVYQLNRYAVKGKVGGLILPKYFNDPPKWVPFANQKVYLLNLSNSINEYNLDEDPGWLREGLWEFGVPMPQDIDIYGHAGCPDPNNAASGRNVFGYNLTGNYTNLMRPKYLTTDNIYCDNKTGVVLKFWRWLGVQREYWEDDSGDRTYYDRATVELSNDGGQTWTVIWSNETSQIEDGVYDSFLGVWKGWSLQFFDISELADGHDVVIRWGMGSTDDSGTFCGWNLDDIGLYESLNVISDPNGLFEFTNTEDVSQNMVLCQLHGSCVKVFNEDGASAINYIKEIQGDLQDPITLEWHIDKTTIKDFDEFNVFYHINLLLSYIQKIDPLYDAMNKKGPINVYVRYGDNYKNAFWTPDNKIFFGEGDSRPDGYRNFTHFSDIIYHEYAHAITESFYSFLMPPLTLIRKSTDGGDNGDGEQRGPVFVTEFDALHEAFSDYWACTINNDSLVGEGDFWVKHKYLRNLDNKFKYPDDYGDDAYANSLIVSGAMWEIRELVGQDVTDTLFHFARYGGATTFDDFLIDVLLQDEISFDGEHMGLIKDIFGQRGISRAPSKPIGLVAVAGDTYIELKWETNIDMDEVDGYYLYFRTENDIASSREDPSVRRDAGSETTYRLEGLTNGTTYVLKVTAYNIYRTESEDSDFVYATPYTETSRTSLGVERKVFCFINTL